MTGGTPGRFAGGISGRVLCSGQLVRGVSAQRRHARRVLAGFVVRRPVDRGALQKADPHALRLDDRRARAPRRVARPLPVCGMPSRSSAASEETIASRAVVHVVRVADGVKPAELERLRRAAGAA